MKKAPLESRIVLHVKMMLEARGAFVVKIHGSPLQVAGLPDLMGCYRGYFIGLEVKRPGGEATKLQEFMLSRIARAGGVARTIHSVEEAEAVLNSITGPLEDRKLP
jgi:hypothetical protein